MSDGGELFHPGTRAPITHDAVLVVEGRDMFGFFLALLRQLGLDQQIEVRNGGGLPGFHDYFQDLVLINEFSRVTALGIVRDCEDNPAGALQQVCAGLQRASLAVPSSPLVATSMPPQPQVTVMLLPDSNTSGMLETLCWRALGSDPRIPCIDEYLKCVEQVTGQPVRGLEKSRIHTYIAAREEPWFLLGQAARAGYFPWDSPAFDEVKRFVSGLIPSQP
jgi:hypothetical protein